MNKSEEKRPITAKKRDRLQWKITRKWLGNMQNGRCLR